MNITAVISRWDQTTTYLVSSSTLAIRSSFTTFSAFLSKNTTFFCKHYNTWQKCYFWEQCLQFMPQKVLQSWYARNDECTDIINISTQKHNKLHSWHSTEEQRGCFQWRLFVCLSVSFFVNTITYERLNVGGRNLAVRCNVQKSCRIRIWGSETPPLGPHTPKCGGLLSHYAKNKQTDVGVAVGHATTSISK